MAVERNRFDAPDTPTKTPFEATSLGIAINTVFGLPKATKSVLKTIGRGIARNIGSAGVTLSKPLGGVEEVDPKEHNKVFQTFFGQEPIKSLEDRVAQGEMTIKKSKFAQDKGLDKYALPLAFGGVLADASLDLTPFVSSKNAVKNLVKETTSEGAFKFLMKNNIPEDVAKTYAPQFVKATTKKEVKSLMDVMKKSVGAKLMDEAATKTTPPIEKLINAIKTAGKPREVLEAEFTAARAARAAKGEEVFAKQTGEAGYHAALGKLKGELTKKPQFEELALNVKDIDELYTIAQKHPYLDFFNKITVQNSLGKLIKGSLPTKGELQLLETVYGSELIKTILAKRGFLPKLGDAITEAMNIPRTIITSMDMSAPLRQGVLFTTKPVIFSRAMKEMFKQVFSPKNFKTWLDELPTHPYYKQMQAGKLYIADPDSLAKGLAGREEAFMSNVAQKIPGIGAMVRASERAFVGFLNKLRVDTFSDMVTKFGAEQKLTTKELKSIANFVNTATGRGSLGAFERSAQALNTVFFSPRLIAARFNMMNPAWYAKQTPAVRKEAVKTMLKFVGLGSTILALAKGAGADVETDPRSSDFGKIKIGNTRWDIWGGFQQWVRVTSQMITREKKTLKGEVQELSKEQFPFDTPLDVAIRFGRGKFAPIPSLAVELVDGQKLFGGDIELKKEVAEKTVPLYLQDVKDAIDEEGLDGALSVGLPAFFGVGVQVYQKPKRNRF